MRVFGRDKLTKFYRQHTDTKAALETWYYEAEQADWQCPQDIKDRYASASFLADNRVIFNIKGNHYRLVVKVFYRHGHVIVEWVGTHADYDRKRF